MMYVRAMRAPKQQAPAFQKCRGCVTYKRCKERGVCDAASVQESPEGQENRPAEKISGGLKRSGGKSRRAKKNGGGIQAR